MADGGYNLFSATGMTMTPLGMVAGNTFDFNKPIINSLKVMPIRFLNSGDFPPYYGDEISLGFWSQLGIGIGTSSQSTSSSVTVVCMGDSLTYGAGGGPGTPEDPGGGGGGVNWPDEWENLSNYNVINKGINGHTSGQMLARFNDDVIDLSPDYCVIECGTNDGMHYVPISQCEANIQAMIDLCLANNIKPILAHYIQRYNQMQLALNSGKYIFDPDYMAQYLEDVWEYEQSLGYPCLLLNDATDIDENNANMNYFYNTLDDYIHPGPDGYIKWAELVNDKFDNLALDTIFSLVSGYEYIYNLSKKTFTIYDENSTIIFFKSNVLTMGEMQIDFTVHKSHQFEIIVDSQDLSGWDYIPVSTLPQEYNFGNMEVSNEGVHNIYLPDRVRPYAKNDADNPSWCIKYVCGYKDSFGQDFDLAGSDIKESESGKLDIDYIYTLQKPFSSLYYINPAFYNSIPTNVLYCEYASWFALNKDNTIFNGLLQDFCKLLLSKLSLSLYPMLNPVIRGSTKTSSVYELGSGSVSIVEQEDGAIHRKYISINGEVVAIVEYYDDGKHVHLKVEIKTATGWEVDEQELPTGVVIETEVEPGGRLVIDIIDGESINNRPVYEPWLIKGVEFVWPKYTEDPIEEFYIDILDLSPIWD